MDVELRFHFRNKEYLCNAFIDASEYPCYVFTILRDNELIKEFGDETTIKTDCERLLPKKDDHVALVALREAILYALKTTPEFIAVRRKMLLLNTHKTQIN